MPNERTPEATAAQYDEFVSTRGRELVTRYNAHGIAVGRRHADGAETEQLAVVFYVERRIPNGDPGAIPPFLTFVPRDSAQSVQLTTEVVEEETASLQ